MNALLLLVLVAAADLPPLTAEEGQACTRDRDAVVVRNTALTAESTRLSQDLEVLETAERALEKLQAQMNTDRAALNAMKERIASETSLDAHLKARTEFDAARDAYEALVARYNDGVRAQQARRQPYNAAAVKLNADLADLDAEAKRVDARCAGRSVLR